MTEPTYESVARFINELTDNAAIAAGPRWLVVRPSFLRVLKYRRPIVKTRGVRGRKRACYAGRVLRGYFESLAPELHTGEIGVLEGFTIHVS